MIASIWGRESGGRMTYNAVKAAEISLAKSMAQQLAKDGIRVNSVAPGSILFPGGSWDKRQQADPAGIAEFSQDGIAVRAIRPRRRKWARPWRFWRRRAPAGSAAHRCRSTAASRARRSRRSVSFGSLARRLGGAWCARRLWPHRFLAARDGLRAELLGKPLHAAFGIQQLLPARKERMAVRADFQVQLVLGRLGLPGRATGAPGIYLVILRMNPFLHDKTPFEETPIIAPGEPRAVRSRPRGCGAPQSRAFPAKLASFSAVQPLSQ